MKVRFTEFGSCPLQTPPPPVHAEAGKVSTGVETVVDAVCVPLQAVPRVAAPQEYVSAPAEVDGPPEGVKSDVTRTVTVPVPVGVERAR